jgi:hypothetical protein
MGSKFEDQTIAEIDFAGLSDDELADVAENDSRVGAQEAASAEQSRRAEAGGTAGGLTTDALLPPQEPEGSDVPFEDREPEKIIPGDDSDGADTPSGHALREVGVEGDASDYKREKHMKRWLG